jgi:hypothetical protein
VSQKSRLHSLKPKTKKPRPKQIGPSQRPFCGQPAAGARPANRNAPAAGATQRQPFPVETIDPTFWSPIPAVLCRWPRHFWQMRGSRGGGRKGRGTAGARGQRSRSRRSKYVALASILCKYVPMCRHSPSVFCLICKCGDRRVTSNCEYHTLFKSNYID